MNNTSDYVGSVLEKLTLTELALLLGLTHSTLSQPAMRGRLPPVLSDDHDRLSERSKTVGGRPPSTVMLYKIAELAHTYTSHLTDEECRLRVAFCSVFDDVLNRDRELRLKYDGPTDLCYLVRSLKEHMSHYGYMNKANSKQSYSLGSWQRRGQSDE